MLFECWRSCGEAGERQISNGKTKALTHNLGGAPGVRELRERRRLRARLARAASAASCNKPFVDRALPPSAARLLGDR